MGDSVLHPAGVCSNFEPQRWRRKKCKVCFHDLLRHTAAKDAVHLENDHDTAPMESLSVDLDSKEDVKFRDGGEIVLTQGSGSQENITPVVTANLVDEEVKIILKAQEDVDDNDSDPCQQDRPESNPREKSDSIDSFDKHRKDAFSFIRLSAMDRSSNSSLASYDALDEGSSCYMSYGGSRETLDSFSMASAGDLADENISKEKDAKIAYLEQEIERLIDTHRATEAGKDRQIQCLEREIQNLRLEIANFTARENVSVLKSRLELESKSLKIQDLENEVRLLRDTIEKMTVNKHFEETDQDKLQRELTRSKNKNVTLEEEKKTLEERLMLAEDLQKNDRELLEVLRRQLVGLEKDLSFYQERSKALDEKGKTLEKYEHELVEEKVKNTKCIKQIENLSHKLHQRDKQVNDLEDDNVRLQQLNVDYRKEINRDLEIIEKLESKILLHQKEVDECNREIIILAAERKKLQQRKTTVNSNDQRDGDVMTSQLNELEEKLLESDRLVQELQLENDQLVREVGDLLENLATVNSELEESKNYLQKAEKELEGYRKTRRDNERKIHSLQKKLNRIDREKKRLIHDKLETNEKISNLQVEIQKTAEQLDEAEKSKKMLLLKFQSTEAKLAMIEGNKVYVESKLNTYESKMREQADQIKKFGFLYSAEPGDEVKDLKEQNIIYKHQLDITTKLAQDNERIIEELKQQNKEYSMSLVSLQKEVMHLKETLSRTQTLNETLQLELTSKFEILTVSRDSLEKSLCILKSHHASYEMKVTEIETLCKDIKLLTDSHSVHLSEGLGSTSNGLLGNELSSTFHVQHKRCRLQMEDSSVQFFPTGKPSYGIILPKSTFDNDLSQNDNTTTDLKMHESCENSFSSHDKSPVVIHNVPLVCHQEPEVGGKVPPSVMETSVSPMVGSLLPDRRKANVTDFKTFLQPKRSRRRSTSAPELSAKIRCWISNNDEGAGTESQVKKVMTSSFHVTTPRGSRRVFPYFLGVDRPLPTKSVSETSLINTTERNINGNSENFVVQSELENVTVKQETAGRVFITISPSLETDGSS